MSKETDVALKNLLMEILGNIETDDILTNAGIKPSGTSRRSATASLKKMKGILGALSAEVEAAASGGIPYKNTFIRELRDVNDVRLNGRKSKDGVYTPLDEWGVYELLSYFFELYYNRTGREFPLETPAVTYQQYIKAKGKWGQKVTRGLSVMSRLIKVLDGAYQVKAYLDWWFMTSFSGKPISWGWLASATMIAMFQSNLAMASARQGKPSGKDTPLPEDFVEWVEEIEGIHKYVSLVKTFKQLMYLYNAWKSKMGDAQNPVVKMLNEAVARGLIQELS